MPRPTILLGEPGFAPAARRVLEACGEVVEFEDFERRLEDADAVVLGLELALRKPLLDRAPRLRLIATRTSGLDHVDVDEARRRGIEILRHEPDAPAVAATTSTAELALALLLALARHVPWAFDSVKGGRWERARYHGVELQGKTLGIVGYGRLGQMVAGYARALGMTVLVHDPRAAESIQLDELLARSDAVSLHAPYTPGEAPLLGARELRLMKPGALLANTARGGLVDEPALLAALEEGRLGGAAIDTFDGEQPDGSHLAANPLVEYARTHENLLLVPHLGGATTEAAERTQLHVAELVADWFARNREAP